MRLGLERAGWSIVFANDIDQQKHDMYSGHFRDTDNHFWVGDIHKIPIQSVPTVLLATASFPCNDLSLAGARKGLSGKQSSAFWGFTTILEKMAERKPLLILLENVTGFLTSNEGRDFAGALQELNRIGYSVDAFILDASHFVPQSRQRLFIVGSCQQSRSHARISATPCFYESVARPPALAKFILLHPEIDWNLYDLPPLPTSNRVLSDILEDLSDDVENWWSTERAEYLLNQMSPKHRQVADEMIAGTGYSYGTVFRRIRNSKSMAELRTDGIAGCLRTPRGGSGRQILFKAGKGRYWARLLSPRECGRLMGTDDYTITVSLNQALFGFGDAVCVPVVEWIARNYLNPLAAKLLCSEPQTNHTSLYVTADKATRQT